MILREPDMTAGECEDLVTLHNESQGLYCPRLGAKRKSNSAAPKARFSQKATFEAKTPQATYGL